MCKQCTDLLAEGLNLCVRARKLDAQERTNTALAASVDGDAWEKSGHFSRHAARHNVVFPDTPMMTKSGTIHLWVLDQYESDLADWERKSRAHLTRGCELMGEKDAD